MSTDDRTSCITAADVPDARWQKAQASGNNGGSCVEVAFLPDRTVAVRDSKNPEGAVLTFTANEWAAFYIGMAENDPRVAPPAEWVSDFRSPREALAS